MKAMSDSKTKPVYPSRQILTDSRGHATQVVLTVEDFQEIEELIEDLKDFQEYYRVRETEQTIPWDEARKDLGV